MKFSRFDRLALRIVLLLGVALFCVWREAQSWKPKLIVSRSEDLLKVNMALDGHWDATDGDWKIASQGKFPSGQPSVLKASQAQQACVARLLKDHPGHWMAPVWSRDNTMVLLLSAYDPYAAVVFSTQNGRIISRMPSQRSSTIGYGGVFSPDNRMVAIRENEPCRVRFFDSCTGHLLWSLYNQAWSVENQNFAFTPDSRYVIALDLNHGNWVLNLLVVYDAQTGKVVRKLKRTPTNQTLIPPIQISPDGTQIRIGDHGGHLWQIRAF